MRSVPLSSLPHCTHGRITLALGGLLTLARMRLLRSAVSSSSGMVLKSQFDIHLLIASLLAGYVPPPGTTPDAPLARKELGAAETNLQRMPPNQNANRERVGLQLFEVDRAALYIHSLLHRDRSQFSRKAEMR